MALLAESGRVSSPSINIALLPEAATTTSSGWGIRSAFDTLLSEVGIRETLTRPVLSAPVLRLRRKSP